MYDKIWSTKLTDYKSFNPSDSNNYINVGKINLIIGKNNSGKSWFLRQLFESDEKSLLVRDSSTINSKQTKELVTQVSNLLQRGNDVGRLSGDGIHDILDNKVTSVEKLWQTVNAYNSLVTVAVKNRDSNRPTLNRFDKNLNQRITEIIESAANIDQTDDPNQFHLKEVEFSKHIYIPILRSLRVLNSAKDHFKARTERDYFRKLTSSKEEEKKSLAQIMTGHKLYDLLKKMLLGQPEERELVRKYETLLGNVFFQGSQTTLIPEHGTYEHEGEEHQIDTIALKIGDEKQRPVYELGDGMQQIIMITMPAFLNKEETLFFIEEPETNMHPGMQRQLIRFLLQKTNHQYFITTHSNHLLDLADDFDSVYTYRVVKELKEGKTEFLVKDCSKNRDVLHELGVKPSSVMLSNATIWVEGITDRFYLKRFMEKYLEELKMRESERAEKFSRYNENTHFSFVEYQGSNLGHWNFKENEIDHEEDSMIAAFKLCSEAFLIADGDIINKGNRKIKYKEQLGDRFYPLDAKEIENIIPQTVLIETAKKEFERRNGPDGKVKENLDVNTISEENLNSYENSERGIGYHLDTALKNSAEWNEEDTPAFFSGSKGGTIQAKRDFCEAAKTFMDSSEWSNSKAANELCAKIYEHIEKNNQY